MAGDKFEPLDMPELRRKRNDPGWISIDRAVPIIASYICPVEWKANNFTPLLPFRTGTKKSTGKHYVRRVALEDEPTQILSTEEDRQASLQARKLFKLCGKKLAEALDAGVVSYLLTDFTGIECVTKARFWKTQRNRLLEEGYVEIRFEGELIQFRVTFREADLVSVMEKLANNIALVPDTAPESGSETTPEAPAVTPASPDDYTEAQLNDWVIDHMVALGELIGPYRTKSAAGWYNVYCQLRNIIGTHHFPDAFDSYAWKEANTDRRLSSGAPFGGGRVQATEIEHLYLGKIKSLNDTASAVTASVKSMPEYLKLTPPSQSRRKKRAAKVSA